MNLRTAGNDDVTAPLPRYARAMDAFAVAIGVGALALEITGGPRFTVLGVPVSLRGGTRPLVLAAAIAAIRHLLVRQRPLHRRLAAGLARAARDPFLRHVLPAFVVSRVSVLLVGYIAALLIAFPASSALPPAAGADATSALMTRWDALWYHDIATRGYRMEPVSEGQYNIAFFPAYPLIVRYVSYLVGGRVMIAGLLVSLAAFLGALAYLFALARDQLGEERAAACVLLLACYPFSVYYSAVYTESLFLLAATGAIYHLGRRQLGRAAFWALVAGLTRPNGCLLAVVLAAFAVQQYAAARAAGQWRWIWIGRPAQSPLGPSPRDETRRRLLPELAVVLMPVVGMLLFSLYVYRLTGHPLAWMSAQAAWDRHFDALAGFTSGPMRSLVEYGVLPSLANMPVETLNSLAALFALVIAWPVWRRFGLPLALFVVLNLVAPLAVGGVMAIGRYTAVLFPIFLWLAAAVPAERRPLWVCAFASGQALVAALFFTWRPMF